MTLRTLVAVILAASGCAQYASRPPTDSLAPTEWTPTMRESASSAAAARSPATIEDRLRKLSELRDEGLITPDEARVRRAEILKEL